MINPERRPLKNGPFLRDIPEISPEWVGILSGFGIVTMEEFYSTWHMGSETLRESLGISLEEGDQIPDIAKSYLGKERVAEIDAFVPIARPLGARKPHA